MVQRWIVGHSFQELLEDSPHGRSRWNLEPAHYVSSVHTKIRERKCIPSLAYHPDSPDHSVQSGRHTVSGSASADVGPAKLHQIIE